MDYFVCDNIGLGPTIHIAKAILDILCVPAELLLLAVIHAVHVVQRDLVVSCGGAVLFTYTAYNSQLPATTLDSSLAQCCGCFVYVATLSTHEVR